MDPRHLIVTFGTVGLLAIIFAESSLVFFLPGDTLLFAAGLLASQHQVNLAVAVVGSFAAAVAGNQVAYLIGARVGPALFKPNSRMFKAQYVEKANGYFDRFGPRTIVLARFIPGVRTFAPILAGVGSMRYRVFVAFNVLGALAWTVGVTVAGYGLGKTVPNVDRYLLPIILGIGALSAVPVILEARRHRREKAERAGREKISSGRS